MSSTPLSGTSPRLLGQFVDTILYSTDSPTDSTFVPTPPLIATFPKDNLHDTSIPQITLPSSTGETSFLYRCANPAVRQRTAQACDKCRDRKTKCTGTKPTCKRCTDRGLQCTYSSETRVRGSHKSRPKQIIVDNDDTIPKPASPAPQSVHHSRPSSFHPRPNGVSSPRTSKQSLFDHLPKNEIVYSTVQPSTAPRVVPPLPPSVSRYVPSPPRIRVEPAGAGALAYDPTVVLLDYNGGYQAAPGYHYNLCYLPLDLSLSGTAPPASPHYILPEVPDVNYSTLNPYMRPEDTQTWSDFTQAPTSMAGSPMSPASQSSFSLGNAYSDGPSPAASFVDSYYESYENSPQGYPMANVSPVSGNYIPHHAVLGAVDARD